MRVMVTGGTGFVGSHAVVALLAAGHEVRLLVRTPSKAKAVFDVHGVQVDDLVAGDMTDPVAVATAIDGCDACLHTAAVVAVSTQGASQDSNTLGTRIVLGAAARARLDPIVYTSTIGIFVPSPDPVITVDSPLVKPLSTYGFSKLGAEHYTRGLVDAGHPVVSFYPGTILGPDQPVLDSGVEGLADAVKVGLPLLKTGGLPIIDVRDLAQMIVAAMAPGQGPKRYMTGGRFLPWPDVAATLSSVTGRQLRTWKTPGGLIRGIGRGLDLVRKAVPIDYALNAEAAMFMTRMGASDDSATHAALGVEYRPTADTMRDMFRWLVANGHLAPKYAPALA